MSTVQTENSYIKSKVHLRESLLPKLNKIKVLDAFSGDGKIWEIIIMQNPEIKFEVLRIEKKRGKKGTYLVGDNIKYLKTLPLSDFDIIDLDAYGVPYEQLKIIFQRGYRGLVFVTFIQSKYGTLPKEFLKELGYTDTMLEKSKAVLSRNGLDKMKLWLANSGASRIHIISHGQKHYFGFTIQDN